MNTGTNEWDIPDVIAIQLSNHTDGKTVFGTQKPPERHCTGAGPSGGTGNSLASLATGPTCPSTSKLGQAWPTTSKLGQPRTSLANFFFFSHENLRVFLRREQACPTTSKLAQPRTTHDQLAQPSPNVFPDFCPFSTCSRSRLRPTFRFQSALINQRSIYQRLIS